jgi:hypothetical protein
MIFEHIEQLKQQYTDKYVAVDESRPELARFKGLTGAVKTVNMSGRALVEFDGYNNIGWYDIDPAFLRLVAPPAPKPVESKKDKAAAPKAELPKQPGAGAKPVGEKTSSAAPSAGGKSVADILAAARKPAGAGSAPASTAEAKPATGKVAPGGKGMSMADVLAAARGNKPGGGAPAAEAKAPAAKVAPAAPAAKLPAAAAPAKVAPGGKGMSMDEILAMARGKKPAGAAPAAAAPAAEPIGDVPVAEVPASEEKVAPPEPVAAESAAATATGGGSLKDKFTSVAEQVAYCRKVDAKG